MILGGWGVSRATPGEAPIGIVALAVVALGGALVVPMAVALAAPLATRLARLALGASGALGIQAAAARRDRTALTVGALLVAVAASVALSTWSRSLEVAASSWLGRALPADLYVTQGSVLADQHNVPLDAALWPRLLTLPGVGEAYPVRTVSVDVGARRVLFVAFDTRAYEAASRRRGTGLEVLAGALPPGLLAARPAVAVAENAAHKLGLAPGDVLRVPGRAGPVALEVAAIIRDYASEEGTIAIDRRWLVELFGDARVDSVDLVLAEGATLEGVRAELRRVLGDGGHVFVVAQAEVREEIGRVLAQFLAIFRGVELVALQVALLGVASALFAAVLDRRRELALLAALGATRRQLAALVLAEATFVGLVAAALGVLVGTPLGAVLVTSIAADTTGWRLEVAFPGWAAVRVGALGVVTAIVAALVPARWAATHALRGGVGGVD
jgi:putative ABC transport system permease protein